jgi:hypothetical protein
LPPKTLAKNEITASAKNAINSVRPISIETPAKPVAPKMIATRPSTKKIIAARNIEISLKELKHQPADKELWQFTGQNIAPLRGIISL